MPTSTFGRPPGRRDGRRPPEGRAPLAATNKLSKHKSILEDIARARDGLEQSGTNAALRDAGHGDVVDSLTEVFTYAEEAAARLGRGSDFEGTPPNHALGVTETFRTHVYEAVEAALAAAENDEAVDGAGAVVRKKMLAFLEGTWTPARQPRQSFQGPGNRKVNLNVRVPQARWDAVDEYGKDPAAVADRGYRLTASQVAIAALREHFGEPASAQDSTTA